MIDSYLIIITLSVKIIVLHSLFNFIVICIIYLPIYNLSINLIIYLYIIYLYVYLKCLNNFSRKSVEKSILHPLSLQVIQSFPYYHYSQWQHDYHDHLWPILIVVSTSSLPLWQKHLQDSSPDHQHLTVCFQSYFP